MVIVRETKQDNVKALHLETAVKKAPGELVESRKHRFSGSVSETEGPTQIYTAHSHLFPGLHSLCLLV